MTDAQDDPELQRLMDEYVQSILARNRSVPIIGEFIVSFSLMQASIEDAVVEIVGEDAKILLAGERGPEASRSETSFRHLLMGRAQSDAARDVIKRFHGEVNEMIQYRNRIAHDAWRFSGEKQQASIERRSPKGHTEVQLIDLAEMKGRAERCRVLGPMARPLAAAVSMTDDHRGGWSIAELFVSDEQGRLVLSLPLVPKPQG
jgi:hypothetical protein